MIVGFCTRKLPLILQNLKKQCHHKIARCTSSKALILGIETSCDDTGCAVVDTEGNVLGEALHSQQLLHLNNGGIIPPIAQDLHRAHIEHIVDDAVKAAGIGFSDLSAIAVTVKPGLPLSLMIGIKYAKHLCSLHKRPFIPIHHMKAHALTARMHDKTIEFPFLVLLISGGHCLLAVAKDAATFCLLGDSLDDAPGEAFDKVARRMKLKNVPEYSTLSGGRAVELAASKADNPLQFKFSIPLAVLKDCNFSMAGIKSQVTRHLWAEEKKHDIPPDGLIPDVNNLCAGFQLVLTRHLCHRLQRAMVYANTESLIPEDKQTLVVSGGAACNDFLARGFQMVCDEMKYKFVRPPPKLCTDNGVMIAWNGVEKWKTNSEILTDFQHIDLEKSCPIGGSLAEDVARKSIKCKWVKLTQLNYPQSTDWNEARDVNRI